MKIARIQDGSGQTVTTAYKDDGSLWRLEGNVFAGELKVTGQQVEAIKWCCPVEPKVIICVAANFKSHIEECNMSIPEWPVFFMKNLSAANAHLEPIKIPQVCEEEVDFEGELAIIIGKECCNVSKAKVFDHILGYMVSNDVSARKWQKEKGGGQWCRGKGFDTFCPMGPFFVTKDEIDDVGNLNIKTELNGQIVQDANTNLVSSISRL
jgi:2-keto-4-pentenoate hydratase/2-oxohepta-3-ene-1,7-dioic acid hydratase in catechol pathway